MNESMENKITWIWIWIKMIRQDHKHVCEHGLRLYYMLKHDLNNTCTNRLRQKPYQQRVRWELSTCQQTNRIRIKHTHRGNPNWNHMHLNMGKQLGTKIYVTVVVSIYQHRGKLPQLEIHGTMYIQIHN